MRLLVLIAGLALCTPAAFPATIKQLHVHVPMRDGVLLSTNIFRPGVSVATPVILVRTPYGKGADISLNHQAFVDRGYTIVVQDVRGRHESQGNFLPLEQEPEDGEDTLNWIAKQPWCDGKIGMMGGSYVGMAQWKVAVLNNPHLKAIFPWTAGDDEYRDRFYSPGGAMKLGHRLLWVEENLRNPEYAAPDFQHYVLTLPLRHADAVATGQKLPLMQEIFDHPNYDSFWEQHSLKRQLKNMRVPVFSLAGWYDNYAESDLDAYASLRKNPNQNRIMVGPWPHNVNTPIAGVDFGPDAIIPFRRTQLEWFDFWLKDKTAAIMSRPPVRLFVMGVDQWRDENEWPLSRAKPIKFYLDSGGHANSLDGNGILRASASRKAAPDTFVYDPRHPVPTRGGATCCNPVIFPWGPMDQRPVEKRGDVLVYTTGPVIEDTEVTGPIEMVLYASSSAMDTDFTAKLVDVFPDGMARNLTDGVLRARYRKSLSKPELMTPGEIYPLKIDMGVTSNVFRKNHRIRVEISSSNFPRFDRNPNTGRVIADETELRTATQNVFHDHKHASYLLLPVVLTARPATQVTVKSAPATIQSSLAKRERR